MNASAPRYRVFLSYSHADSKWAGWLMRRLESYRVASRFHGRTAPVGLVGPRLAPVFRDRDELPTSGDLGATIRAALAESATLVVICSPASAQSRWVQEEIRMFKRLHGEGRVFAFIVAGEPRPNSPEDCFAPALRQAVAPDGEFSSQTVEVIAADARPQGDGREGAFTRLIAGLIGVGFDDLRRRELQRRYRRMTYIAAGSALGMALTLGLALVAWQARRDAERRQEQAEDLIGFMVSDLRVPLAKLNKLEILDAVGEKAMAYFASLNPRDLTDTALRRQVEALRQIGENRKDQGRYAEALRSLQAAYEGARVLSARHPQDGDLHFERGQAEFWIGFVLRRQGRLTEMMDWLTRYRDTGAALVALDPTNPRWQEELAYGHHNLAVVEADNERIDAARQGFLGELAMLNQLAQSRPKDLSLQHRIVDVNSWLGSIAEMDGDLRESAERFATQVASTAAILQAEPDNARWKGRLADALLLQASNAALRGDPQGALELRLRAKSLLEDLARGDPKNRNWLRTLLWAQLREAELRRHLGDLPNATRLCEDAREKFETLLASEMKEERMVDRLSVAYRLQAELLAEQGRDGAEAAAARAVELAESLVQNRQSVTGVTVCALARLTAGKIAARQGRNDVAHAHWRRALEVLEPRLPGSNHWRILFPAACAYALTGRPEVARTLVARLRQLGFHPLEPWPELPATAPTFPHP